MSSKSSQLLNKGNIVFVVGSSFPGQVWQERQGLADLSVRVQSEERTHWEICPFQGFELTGRGAG